MHEVPEPPIHFLHMKNTFYKLGMARVGEAENIVTQLSKLDPASKIHDKFMEDVDVVNSLLSQAGEWKYHLRQKHDDRWKEIEARRGMIQEKLFKLL